MRHGYAIAPASPLLATGSPGRHRLAPLWARLLAFRLDRELAEGVAPWRSPAHAARARQLTSERTRRHLAHGRDHLLEEAEQPMRFGRGALVQPSDTRIREARPDMLMMVVRLRACAPLAPRGMAALKRLLSDGAGPVYTYGDPEALKRRLLEIDGWLNVQD